MKQVKLRTICISTALFFPGCKYNAVLSNRDQINVMAAVAGTGEEIFIVTKLPTDKSDYVSVEKLAQVGTICKLTKFLRNNISEACITVETRVRATVKDYRETPEGIFADITEQPDEYSFSERELGLIKKLSNAVKAQLRDIGKIDTRIASIVNPLVKGKKLTPGELADQLADFFFVGLEERRTILDCFDVIKRLDLLSERIAREIDHMGIAKNIAKRARDNMDKQNKEHYLREQMKIITDELGEDDETGGKELKQRLEKCDLPAEIADKLKRDIARMERAHPMSGESSILRNYIETVLDLPWTKASKDETDLRRAREQLDRDHYNMDDLKNRIIELIAVMTLNNESPPGQILCLVGPPGVGKTSIAESVARALGREFIRASLGGVRDESEIRGHRRTYVGALPGKVISGMKKAGTINPVFLFDEIDKMAHDFRGDPASAMLEVLDPVQNKTFADHYLEVPYDLSRVLFICTANDENQIPWALQDRMEVINLSSYTLIEKEKIAREFLLPRLAKEHGLTNATLQFDDDSLKFLIESYTREAGVRELSRVISSLLRKVALHYVGATLPPAEISPSKLNPKTIVKMLGKEKYSKDDLSRENTVGVVNGLSFTAVGGDVLKLEVALTPGKGELKLTGRLGEVMRESAQIALSVTKTLAKQFDIDPEIFEKRDVHIHVPSGAVPKDGPSAGAALTVALVSAFSNRPVRGDYALSGEVTLSARVLEIGGVREKVLSAHRYGITNIILPKNNKKSLDKVPKEVTSQMNFTFADNINDVLKVLIV